MRSRSARPLPSEVSAAGSASLATRLRAGLAIGALSISLVSIDARPSSALSFEGQEARLERELREGVTPQRVTAASEIATLAPRAAWPLVQLGLADPEIEVRRRAVTAAEELGLREALELTRPWLESDDAELREIAVHAEGVLGDAASVASLSRALGDPRFAVRSAAAEALGRLGLAACASALGTALEDTDATVRMVAASALGRTPGDEAARLLLSRSLDPVLEVRVRVIDALAARADHEGSFDGRVGAVLIAALADEAPEVRVAAIVGLARARHAPAAPLLARMLDEAGEQRRTTEDDREVRAVVAALGRLDEASARAALVLALGRGIAPSSALRATRAQLVVAPEAMERALADGLVAGADFDASPSRARVLDAMLELDELAGGDDLLRPVLAGLEDGSFSAPSALAALGAFMPRSSEASVRSSGATEEAVVVLLSRASEPTTVDAAIDGLERAARRGVLDPRSVEVLLLPEVIGPETLADADGRRDPDDALRAARVVSLLGRLDDPRATPTLLRVATGPEGAPRRAALVALSRSRHVDHTTLAPLSSEVTTLLQSHDPEERAAIRAIAVRHGDDGTLLAVLDALDALGAIDRAVALEVVVARLAHASPALRARAEGVIVDALASSDTASSSAAAAAIVRVTEHASLIAAASERVASASSRGDRRALARAARAIGCETVACRALGGRSGESDLDLLAGGDDPHALLEPELRFPASNVRSFALLTAVRRGAIGVEAVPALCELAARREPTVRANAGLSLASLGASCDDIDPTHWLAHAQSVAVQLAGAHWCASLERASPERAAGLPPATQVLACDARRLERAVARCLDTAGDPSLRSACESLRDGTLAAPSPVRDATLDVTITDAGGRSATRRLVSLRFLDGASLVVSTDDAARVAMRLDRVVRDGDDLGASVVIEDPYATVLER